MSEFESLAEASTPCQIQVPCELEKRIGQQISNNNPSESGRWLDWEKTMRSRATYQQQRAFQLRKCASDWENAVRGRCATQSQSTHNFQTVCHSWDEKSQRWLLDVEAKAREQSKNANEWEKNLRSNSSINSHSPSYSTPLRTFLDNYPTFRLPTLPPRFANTTHMQLTQLPRASWEAFRQRNNQLQKKAEDIRQHGNNIRVQMGQQATHAQMRGAEISQYLKQNDVPLQNKVCMLKEKGNIIRDCIQRKDDSIRKEIALLPCKSPTLKSQVPMIQNANPCCTSSTQLQTYNNDDNYRQDKDEYDVTETYTDDSGALVNSRKVYVHAHNDGNVCHN